MVADSCRILPVSAGPSDNPETGPTESPPPYLPQLLEVDLILRILEKVLLPHSLPYEGGLKVRPPPGDLVDLILDISRSFDELLPAKELTLENKPFSCRSLSSGRVASSWNWTFSMIFGSR